VSGFAITHHLQDFERLTTRLQRMERIDKGALLDVLGNLMANQTRRRIQDEKQSPSGEPWQEWSATHAATRHSGQSLLQGGGDLQDSIQHVVTGDQVETGSNMVYAGVQQRGAKQGEFGRTGRNGPIPWGDMPAREYLGLSEENAAELIDTANRWLDMEIGKL